MTVALPDWALALDDDPAFERLGKPPNLATNWVHANPNGRRLRADYFVDKVGRNLIGVAVFGDEAEGLPGLAHGGAITSLIDDALGTTAWLAGHYAMSLNLNVDFRRVIRLGVPVRLDASVSRVEGRKVYAACRIISPPDTLHSEGAGLFLQVPPPGSPG